MDIGGVETRDYLIARSWCDNIYTSKMAFLSSLLANPALSMLACPTVREWTTGRYA